MIITKSVKVFKKNGSYNIVEVSDLSLNSHKLIVVKCDICFSEKEVRYQDYNKVTLNQTQLYYCGKCCKSKSNDTKRRIYGDRMQGIVDKQKITTLDKYGVDNISKSEFFKELKKNTTMKNYGVDAPSKSQVVKDKMKATCLKKYGVEYSLQCEEVRNKINRTIIDKYGVNNVFQSEEIQKKIKETLLNKYGADHPMRCVEIFQKQMTSSLRLLNFEGLIYQGTYELDFILFCKLKNIKLERGPVVKYDDRSYFPDFFIRDKNLIVEIKSTYTFVKEYDKNLRKKKACQAIGFNFLFIIDKNYTSFSEFMLI